MNGVVAAFIGTAFAQDDADAASSAGLDNRRQRILWPTDYVIPPYLPLHYVYHVYGDANWTEMRSVGKGENPVLSIPLRALSYVFESRPKNKAVWWLVKSRMKSGSRPSTSVTTK